MIIKDTRVALEKKAAEIIAETIKSLLAQRECVVLGVVGGSSVANVFEHLGDEKTGWERVHLFLIDERLVPLDHADSNYGVVQPFFSGILPEENLHPFVLEKDAADQGVEKYKKELMKFGGKYDVILVSSGEDGHIGALFPDHFSIDSEAEFFLTMNDSPKPPKERMTASRNLLQRAETGILLLFGNGKAKAFHDFQREDIPYRSCPAKILGALPEYYILTDQGGDR